MSVFRSLPVWVVITAGALVVSLSMGIRQSFGLFLSPMSLDLEIGREAFALALAIQNLIWGCMQPFAGMIADRYGSGRVIAGGGILYLIGLLIMADAESIWGLHIGGGLLIGFALSGVTFGVVLGAIGRQVTEEKRSLAFGIATAGGSLGMAIMGPLGQAFIGAYGWPMALVIMAAMASVMAMVAVFLTGRPETPQQTSGAAEAEAAQTMGRALREAAGHSGYRYLTLGFFVCGFHVAFIGVHLPAYVADVGLSPHVGAFALALIGLFNIVGTFTAGWIGGRYSKKNSLAWLYGLRALVFLVFLIAPKTEMTVYIFSATIGLLWLSTVPLTSGLVAQIFGVRYMSTLFGIVFFSHQIGSFVGVWWGGWLFDVFGSYDYMWIASVIMGVVSAALHLPIREGRHVPEPARA
ncbi:MAG: MFS transporter [Magnetovibrionaceae bacterium]